MPRVVSLPTMLALLELAGSLRVPVSPRMQLLGPDGRPIGGGRSSPGSSATPGRSGLLGVGGAGSGAKSASPKVVVVGGGGAKPAAAAFGSMPEDLADFDPSFDPLAAARPKYDLAGASGRGDEAVWGAVAPSSADAIAEWTSHMLGKGIKRVLGLFTEEDAAARSPDGSAAGYMGALVAAGFEPSGVSLLDPRLPGSRDIVLAMCRDAYAEKVRLCVHCADGTTLTSVAMADWLLSDYVGGNNAEEACDLLATRKRLAGVERRTAPEQLECWVTNGCLADVTPVHAKTLVVDAWLERRAKLETPSNIQVVDDLM